MQGMGKQIGKVNWVKCPKCNYRYYCGPPIFYMEGVPAKCPKCRHEFNAWDTLEPRWSQQTVSEMKN